MSPRALILLPVVLLALLTPSAAVTVAAADDAPVLSVFVSIPPQAWLVERLGGARVAVEVMLPPDASPSSFDPSPRQIARLAGARAWFVTGVPMEAMLLPKARRFPGLEIVDTAAGLDLLPAEDGDGHDHDHGETDPHVWLSPRLFAAQARTVAAALADLDPDNAALYAANLESATDELAALADDVAALLAPVRGRVFYTMHPAFAYLGADHGLKQVALERGGLSPGPRHLASTLTRARDEGVSAIFSQPQQSRAPALTAAREIGVAVVELDPLARDYPANLRRLAAAVAAALGGTSAEEAP